MLLLSLFKISGHSMEPTLLQGQTVLVSFIPYLFSKPKVGDIVVVKYSKRRHSGLTGYRLVPVLSRISLQHGANGDPACRQAGILESQSGGRRTDPQNDEGDKFLIKRITKIKDGKYFVSGDNKEDSFDSRRFGWISKKDILGKVILKL